MKNFSKKSLILGFSILAASISPTQAWSYTPETSEDIDSQPSAEAPQTPIAQQKIKPKLDDSSDSVRKAQTDEYGDEDMDDFSDPDQDAPQDQANSQEEEDSE